MRDADELKSEKHHVIRGQTEHRDLQIENTSIQIVLSFVLILKKKKSSVFWSNSDFYFDLLLQFGAHFKVTDSQVTTELKCPD